MKTLFFVGIFVVINITPSLSCDKYPKLTESLTQSLLTSARKFELLAELNKGKALHEEAHNNGDMTKMTQSLTILNEIKAQIGE